MGYEAGTRYLQGYEVGTKHLEGVKGRCKTPTRDTKLV